MQFRERDGVCIQYDVRGKQNSVEYPYVNDLPTLRAAIEIGKTYPDIYGDGSATHIVRRYSRLLEPGKSLQYMSGDTHRWRVDRDGRLQLLVSYSRATDRRRENQADFAKSLPKMRYPATSVHTQLVDLALFADAMGLREAAKAISNHVHGWSPMPEFAKFRTSQTTLARRDSCDSLDKPPVESANDSLWTRLASWASSISKQ